MVDAKPPAAAGESGQAGPTKEVNGRLVRAGQKEAVSISASGFRIGRDPLSELVVADAEVSRLHAEIRYEGGRYVLYDFSSNGTWVNGALVAERRTLRMGDVMKIGGQEFRFLVDRVPAATQTPPLPPAKDPAVRAAAMAGATVRQAPERAKSRPGFFYLLLLVVIAAAVYFFVFR